MSSSPVNVPAQLFGMQYLNARTTAAGYNSQWARNHDQKNNTADVLEVKSINPADGVYNYASLDAWAAQNADKQLIFNLGCPADWCIGRTATGGAAYGGKSNMCPTGATELTAYLKGVTALVTRLKNTWGRTGIVYEAWNEIGNRMFYNDSFAALGPYIKAVNQAIKAVDPTALLLCPSYISGVYGRDSATNASLILPMSDGAGGKAGDWLDGIAVHVYSVGAWSFKSVIDFVKEAAVNANYPSLASQIYITESGVLFPTEGQADDFPRRIVVMAAQGVKCVVLYAVGYDLNPDVDNYGSTVNAASVAIAGKTLSDVFKLPDGRVSFRADGVPGVT